LCAANSDSEDDEPRPRQFVSPWTSAPVELLYCDGLGPSVSVSPQSFCSGFLADPYRDDGLGGLIEDENDEVESAFDQTGGGPDAETAAPASNTVAASQLSASQLAAFRGAVQGATGLGAAFQADILQLLNDL